MKKTLEWLRDYGIILLVVVLLIGSMQTCATRVKVDRNTKRIEQVNHKIDSLTNIINSGYVINKDELPIILQIENLRGAKMTLYDWNAVVRTVVRPDDRMNWYDQEIYRLQNKLDSIRVQKRR